MTARQIAGRLWQYHFVAGVGFLFIAVAMTSDAAGIGCAFLAFSAGISFCTWVDRMHFDRLHEQCMDLARTCDKQQSVIAALVRKIEALK